MEKDKTLWKTSYLHGGLVTVEDYICIQMLQYEGLREREYCLDLMHEVGKKRELRVNLTPTKPR